MKAHVLKSLSQQSTATPNCNRHTYIRMHTLKQCVLAQQLHVHRQFFLFQYAFGSKKCAAQHFLMVHMVGQCDQ